VLGHAGSWDTGIALINTSKDNITSAGLTRSSDGACLLSFFGTNAPASEVAFPATGLIAAGTEQAALVSSLAADFEGYVIARCNFQFGHGFAEVFSPTFGASAYLALVIPEIQVSGVSLRLPEPNVLAGPNSGEQLGF
jgi:hypothetical protein